MRSRFNQRRRPEPHLLIKTRTTQTARPLRLDRILPAGRRRISMGIHLGRRESGSGPESGHRRLPEQGWPELQRDFPVPQHLRCARHWWREPAGAREKGRPRLGRNVGRSSNAEPGTGIARLQSRDARRRQPKSPPREVSVRRRRARRHRSAMRRPAKSRSRPKPDDGGFSRRSRPRASTPGRRTESSDRRPGRRCGPGKRRTGIRRQDS